MDSVLLHHMLEQIYKKHALMMDGHVIRLTCDMAKVALKKRRVA
jgi:hypothetical protein